jgi:hypothetical protein
MPTVHPADVPLPPLSSGVSGDADSDDFVLVEAESLVDESLVDDFVWVEEGPTPRPLAFCPPASLTPDQREQLGEQFRKQALDHVRQDCDRTIEADRRAAARRLRTHAGGPAQAEALVDRIVSRLQASRLTINFRTEQLIRSDWLKRGEYLNCFALGENPAQPPGYAVGRAQIEEHALGMRRALNDSPFRDFGRFESDRDATRRQPWFQSNSRPLYAALDFLNGPRGGARHFGGSFLVLADHMKEIASFTPVDSFATRLGRDAVTPDKVCTWHHFPRLVAHAQDDRVGYSCLAQLCRAADGLPAQIPDGYGRGGANNHIEAQIYGRIRFDRDVKEIHVSDAELDELPRQRRQRLIEDLKEANRTMGRRFYIVD